MLQRVLAYIDVLVVYGVCVSRVMACEWALASEGGHFK